MLCAPSNRRRPFSYHTKMADFEYFSCFVRFLVNKLAYTQKSVLNMASSDSQFGKPQRGHPRTAELPDVNINTGAPKHNTERDSLSKGGRRRQRQKAIKMFRHNPCVFLST